MPLEAGEETASSVEIRRRALEGQSSGRLSRGSFETVWGSDQFDDLSALGLRDASPLPFHDSVQEIALDADEEDLGVRGRRPSLGSVVV